MKTRILYVGNNLREKTNNVTAMLQLSLLFESKGIHVFKTSDKTNKIARLLDMCMSVLKYRNMVDMVLIDTYSTSNFYFAFIISQISRILKLKYIPILHGGNLPIRLKNSPNMSEKIFKNSYRNVSPSKYLQSEFKKNNYETLVIPNSININEYDFKERSIIRPRLLFVRAFAKIYNPILAIKVLFELKKKYPESKLCMVGPDSGDGTLEEVKELIIKLNIVDSVEITGSLKKTDWHKKSEGFDIFINTTNVDNTPVSVIEAMALGLVIVSTNVGGLPYLINNNKDGVLVTPNNNKEMTNAIVSILNSPEKGYFMTNSARKKVEEFDGEVVIENWLKILN